MSQVTGEECAKIARLYGLNKSEPTDLERAHTPLEGHVMLSETNLRFRVGFPLNLFFVAVLKHYGLTVFHITPNGWAHMIRLFGLFAEQGLGPPTVEEFGWFYLVKSNKGDEGFYYFSKRPAKGLNAMVGSRTTWGPRRSHISMPLRSRLEVPSAV